MIGTTLGHYRVTAALGTGGMGEVWRARDEKLGRDVALKVLPADFAADPERVARFEHEAKVLASLNHPNIAHLYGLESEASGAGTGSGFTQGATPGQAGAETTFLVMELVEGDDLSERIKRGAIPVDEAIPIARQIAEALEAAHEAGIVHRDLKPANIKITDDGTVKVLDFGLAKVWEAEGSDTSLSLSPTMTAHATAAGIILGTAAYMSPDQARGKKVDRRADIWAFGVVLWEMLTGRKLFEGDTVSDVLASVLKEPPDLEALPQDTPIAVRRLLARCLEREPRKRLQWIGDARLELENETSETAAISTLEHAQESAPNRGASWLGWIVAAAAIVVALVAALRPAPEVAPPSVRFSIQLEQAQNLSFIDERIIAISRDGRRVAMTATSTESGLDMIFVRHLDEPELVPVAGTEGAGESFFSPDGKSIAFFADGKLKRVLVGGGGQVTLAEAPNARGGVWLPDDTIVYSPEYAAGLWRVEASGGIAEVLLDVDPTSDERTFRLPDASPDGSIIVFTVGSINSPNNYGNAVIEAFDLESGARRVVLERSNMARFVGDDHLLFARQGDLFLVGFDPESLRTVGEPVPAVEGVGGDPSSGAGHFAVAANGTLAWVSGLVTSADTVLVIADADGQTERVNLEIGGFHQPRFSPDGKKIAFSGGVGYSGVEGDVWIYTLANGATNRLTFGGNDLCPVWSPDGRRIAYLSYSAEAEILEKPADGSGTPVALTSPIPEPVFPESFTPDGRLLAFSRIGRTSDIYLVSRGEEPRLFESNASGPVISPDGRWVAYQSPGSGSGSVFVRPLDGEGKWQVSPSFGGYPRWTEGGRRLLYIDTSSSKRPLMAVEVLRGETFEVGPPQVVLESVSRFVTATSPSVNWDVAPTGKAFAFSEFNREAGAGASVEVFVNWAQTIEQEGR